MEAGDRVLWNDIPGELDNSVGERLWSFWSDYGDIFIVDESELTPEV